MVTWSPGHLVTSSCQGRSHTLQLPIVAMSRILLKQMTSPLHIAYKMTHDALPTLRDVWPSLRVPQRHAVAHFVDGETTPSNIFQEVTPSPALRKARPTRRIPQSHVVVQVASCKATPFQSTEPRCRLLCERPGGAVLYELYNVDVTEACAAETKRVHVAMFACCHSLHVAIVCML